MGTALLVAKVFGVVYVVAGLGMLVNKDYYKKMMKEMMKSSSYMFFGGMMSLALGVIIVLYHNVWVQDWVVLVTIIGWLAVLKGVLLLLAPKALVKVSRIYLDNMNLVGVGALVMGLVFGYFGYLA